MSDNPIVPQVVVSNSDIKTVEISGVVTVGAESATRLTRLLGREVKIGEQFDLGLLAATYPNKEKTTTVNTAIASSPKRLLFTPEEN